MQEWTTVLIDNKLAGLIISFYLETDHPMLGLFDADLFLDDLFSYRETFSSRLLVNAVLCWACVCILKSIFSSFLFLSTTYRADS